MLTFGRTFRVCSAIMAVDNAAAVPVCVICEKTSKSQDPGVTWILFEFPRKLFKCCKFVFVCGVNEHVSSILIMLQYAACSRRGSALPKGSRRVECGFFSALIKHDSTCWSVWCESYHVVCVVWIELAWSVEGLQRRLSRWRIHDRYGICTMIWYFSICICWSTRSRTTSKRCIENYKFLLARWHFFVFSSLDRSIDFSTDESPDLFDIGNV